MSSRTVLTVIDLPLVYIAFSLLFLLLADHFTSICYIVIKDNHGRV